MAIHNSDIAENLMVLIAIDAYLERLIEAPAERGCFLEINAHPDRLDLEDEKVRRWQTLRLE